MYVVQFEGNVTGIWYIYNLCKGILLYYYILVQLLVQ